MSRYISLETLYRALDEIDRQAIKGEEWNVKCITNRIRSIRFYTEDPQEVKHGRWIETTVPELWECSVCGCVIYSETEIDRNIYHKWCGRCGAKMDEVEDAE